MTVEIQVRRPALPAEPALEANPRSVPDWVLVPLFDALAILVATAAVEQSTRSFIAAALMITGALFTGDYLHPRLVLSAMNELPRMLGRSAGAALVGSLAASWLGFINRLPLVCVAVVASLVVVRLGVYALLRSRRRRGHGLMPTILVGGGETAYKLRHILRDHPEFGLRVVRAIDQQPSPATDVVRDLDYLPALIEEHCAKRVIVAYGMWNDQAVVDVVRNVVDPDVEFYLVPRLFEIGGAGGDPRLEDVMGVPLLWLRRRSYRKWQLRKKRAFDVAVTSAAALVLLPVLVALAAAVKLSSPGPVLFRQQRIGRHGREFDLLKFRSMKVNKDSDVTWTVANDTRVTRVGKFIRRTSLDELPQLLNILKGDMSLVGPRPERPFYVEQFALSVPRYRDRHRGPVGLTGLAQVNGLRGDTPIDDRVRLDNSYIDQWSMWGDIVIIVRTFSAAFRGQ